MFEYNSAKVKGKSAEYATATIEEVQILKKVQMSQQGRLRDQEFIHSMRAIQEFDNGEEAAVLEY